MTWNDIVWKGSPNYTQGRQGKAPRFITFHHIVGTMESANSRFQNASQQVSTHFAVGARGVWQFVDTDNTAWGNGNWNSNLESISIEHEGDWRFGYSNAQTLENSAQLVALLRKTHPSIVGFQRHRDVVSTACPGDLPCEAIWNRATEILNPPKPIPAPAPPVPTLQITDIQNRIVVTNKDANLWNLDFTTWAGAQSVKVIPKGTEVEISAVAKHPLGGSYYMTEYSYSKGIRNGLNVQDCSEKEIVPPVVPPVVPPTIPEPPIVPEKPNPDTPKPTKDEEQDARLSSLETAVKALQELLNKVISWITSWRN